MSGVFGLIDGRDPERVPALLARMGASLRHHPWHTTDEIADARRGVGLGRMRGGVFNAETQPLRSDDGRFTVCFSGELYETESQRARLRAEGRLAEGAGDAALVLALYRDHGVELPAHLDGIFCLAVWDAERTELFLAADRFGTYPLYFCEQSPCFLFAPEVKAILCDPRLSRRLDQAALAESIRFQHLLGDKTFFEGVRLLPNGGSALYDAGTGRLREWTYWDASHLRPAPASIRLEEAAEEVGRRLRDAVRKRANGPGRVGLYLSGGLDSRPLLGFLSAEKGAVDTFTYGVPDCRDVRYAERLAAIAGARHHHAPFAGGTWVPAYAPLHLDLTEGFHSWIHAHGISVLDDARGVMDISLSGFRGGHLGVFWDDEPVMHADDEASFAMFVFRVLQNRATWPGLDEAEASMLLATESAAPLRGLALESLERELHRIASLPPVLRATQFDVSNPGRRLYQNLVVFHRSHIEQRLPFCDYRYTEFVYALPPHLNFGRALRRAVLRRELPHLCRVPYSNDGLPVGRSEVGRLWAKTWRRGAGLLERAGYPLRAEGAPLNADYDGWLRRELRDWGHDLLLGPSARRRGLFAADAVEALWRRQQSGREPDFIGKIASLMTLELFFRRFVD